MSSINLVSSIQVGKSGVTEGTISTIANSLKTHNQVRVSFLKSSGRDRSSIKSMSEKIVSNLPLPCFYRIIGFTLVISKRKSVKK